MARRLFTSNRREHTFLTLLIFFSAAPLLRVLNGILFFIETILSGKNPAIGGKNGEKEYTKSKGFGFESWFNGKENTA